MLLNTDISLQNTTNASAIFTELDEPSLTFAERDPFENSADENEHRRNGTCPVLDVTCPFENLPLIKSSALGYIGRCVSLRSSCLLEDGELHDFVFKGFIYCVTPDALCLFHCRRYLTEVFKAESEAAKKGSSGDNLLAFRVVTAMSSEEREAFLSAQNGNEPISSTTANTTTLGDSSIVRRTTQRGSRRLPFLFNASSGRVERFEELHIEYDLHSERHSSAVVHSPFLEGVTSVSGSLENTTSSVVGQGNSFAVGESAEMRPQLKKLACVGPVPFISLLRTKVYNIAFADFENDMDFSPLFMFPDNALRDMTCLRMFVRRHLVLTSLGYNSSGISLKSYISCLCQCPSIDNMLLQKVAEEELKYLLSVDERLLQCPKGTGRTGIAAISRPNPPQRVRLHFPLRNPAYIWRLRLCILQLLILGLAVVSLGVSVVAYFMDGEVFDVQPILYVYCFIIPLISTLASFLGAFHLFFSRNPIHRHVIFNSIHVFANGAAVILSCLAVFFLIQVYFWIQNGSLYVPFDTIDGTNFLPCAAATALTALGELTEIIFFLIFIKYFREGH